MPIKLKMIEILNGTRMQRNGNSTAEAQSSYIISLKLKSKFTLLWSLEKAREKLSVLVFLT